MSARACLCSLIALGACGRAGFELRGDAAAVDLDADGVADARDNCPAIANADQANEDGDALGDACDPCPPYVDADPPLDGDGDGVGDACDPHPSVGGDRIALFEGFARAPVGAERTGEWRFEQGTAEAPSALDARSALTWNLSATGAETVSARGTVLEYFGTGVARPAGVVHFWNPATDDGIGCVFGINPSDDEVFAIASNRTTSALALTAVEASAGSSTTFISTRVEESYRCTGSALAGALTAQSTLTSTPNRVGLFARSVTARFDWVMIVTSPSDAVAPAAP